jgi:hypothetical protein
VRHGCRHRDGVRVGESGGYSDPELGLLVQAGLVDDAAVIATTVHPLQVLDEELPETAHNFRVDLVVRGLTRSSARGCAAVAGRDPGAPGRREDRGDPVLAAQRLG